MMTQNDRILYHLQSRRTITPLEALNLYGCFRLASRICDLKSQGHNIVVRNKTENGKTFAEYELVDLNSKDLFLSESLTAQA